MSIKCYKFCVLLFILVACVTWLSVPAHAREEKRAALKKKLAEITRFMGEVRARRKMIWTEVKDTPFLLFSGDKVVTGKGKAEIVFNNGGILRLDLNSNVKISERKIKVVLGHIYADMSKAPDQEIVFVTPTMTAGVKGAIVDLIVDAKGETSFASNKPVDATGIFKTRPEIIEIDLQP